MLEYKNAFFYIHFTPKKHPFRGYFLVYVIYNSNCKLQTSPYFLSCFRHNIEGDSLKMRLVFCSTAQKWLVLESKLKLEVKTKCQELSNEVLYVSVAQILLKIWLKTKSVIFLNFLNFVILHSDFATFLQKWKNCKTHIFIYFVVSPKLLEL